MSSQSVRQLPMSSNSADQHLMLVVDDDPVFSSQISFFARPQFNVMQYTNPDQIDPIALYRAELIVLDLQMPGHDGIEFLKSLSLVCPHKPVLIISGSDIQVVRMAERVAELLGMTHVRAAQKPVSLSQFRNIVSVMPASPQKDPANIAVSGGKLWSLGDDGKSAVGDRQSRYKPQLDIKTFDVLGLEALPPWTSLIDDIQKAEQAGKDLVSPEIGLDFSLSAIEAVLVDCDAITRDTARHYRFSVSVSSETLASGNFVKTLVEMVGRLKIPANRLVICFAAPLADATSSREVMASMARLKLHGFQLSLRNVSSLLVEEAKSVAEVLDEVVIDSVLLRSLTTSLISRGSVENILRVAGGAGIRVVADGVDDERTLSWLRQLGEPIVQGRLFAHPMNSIELRAWLQQQFRH
ncbi:EAL domain-containing protein [Gammaproteobacteria bacterium LSUCC0112]|nr:EAL domain-containing protein [Gammaproteobacteria bacterium LSUCC0112]